MHSALEKLIDEIRKEERQKLLKEIPSIYPPSPHWTSISSFINEWGENIQTYPWKLHQIRNAVYIIIRSTLGLDRMANLEYEQLEIALDITKTVLNIIHPE